MAPCIDPNWHSYWICLSLQKKTGKTGRACLLYIFQESYFNGNFNFLHFLITRNCGNDWSASIQSEERHLLPDDQVTDQNTDDNEDAQKHDQQENGATADGATAMDEMTGASGLAASTSKENKVDAEKKTVAHSGTYWTGNYYYDIGSHMEAWIPANSVINQNYKN